MAWELNEALLSRSIEMILDGLIGVVHAKVENMFPFDNTMNVQVLTSHWNDSSDYRIVSSIFSRVYDHCVTDTLTLARKIGRKVHRAIADTTKYIHRE